ncbi:MAG: hypothetical protein HY644_15660 [Acidobacteria bacterium]|nr:hypothetical protein [Acidobacteriota bacterium]
MKKRFFVAFMLALAASSALAQSPQPAHEGGPSRLKDFTRSIKFDGLILNLVYLNDRTVDALFQAPTKYSMRARAKQTTMLFVQGMPEKEINLDTTFTIEQGGESITATPHNIKHFEDGKVVKGERIDGILEFSKKVDLSKPFKVKNGKESAEFKFSEDLTKSLN